jgi:hypothetical protein
MATSGAQFELRVDQSRAWLTVPGLRPGEMGLSRVEALRPSSILMYIQSEAVGCTKSVEFEAELSTGH